MKFSSGLAAIFRDVQPSDFPTNPFHIGAYTVLNKFDNKGTYMVSYIYSANGEFLGAFADFNITLQYVFTLAITPS